MLRDPTRGGVAATLNEIARCLAHGHRDRGAQRAGAGRRAGAACGFLGLDPLYVANEGKLVAFVGAGRRGARPRRRCAAHEFGVGAVRIGTRRRGAPGRGRRPDRHRRHAGGRPAARRAAPEDLLTRDPRPRRVGAGGPSSSLRRAAADHSRRGDRCGRWSGGLDEHVHGDLRRELGVLPRAADRDAAGGAPHLRPTPPAWHRCGAWWSSPRCRPASARRFGARSLDSTGTFRDLTKLIVALASSIVSPGSPKIVKSSVSSPIDCA